MTTPCNVTAESHTDHAMTAEQAGYALDAIRNGDADIVVGEAGPAFYIAQVTLPESLGSVPCALRGPAVGDAPIGDADTFSAVRVFGGKVRPNASRMTRLGTIPSRTMTAIVVGGNLATLYGGPLAPQEPGDPFLAPEQAPAAEAFWREHALAAEGFELAE